MSGESKTASRQYVAGAQTLHDLFVDLSAITERRTAKDWAFDMRRLADNEHPDAKRIILVEDNLNTHKPASFYEAFAPEEARRLTQRFEFHHTPKHGSWLNIAEIGLSVLQGECLNRRISDSSTLERQVEAWQHIAINPSIELPIFNFKDPYYKETGAESLFF